MDLLLPPSDFFDLDDDDADDDGLLLSSCNGFKPSLARSLFVSSIDSESPAPFSGIGEGDLFLLLVGFEIIGAGGGNGTSTQSEPK